MIIYLVVCFSGFSEIFFEALVLCTRIFFSVCFLPIQIKGNWKKFWPVFSLWNRKNKQNFFPKTNQNWNYILWMQKIYKYYIFFCLCVFRLWKMILRKKKFILLLLLRCLTIWMKYETQKWMDEWKACVCVGVW